MNNTSQAYLKNLLNVEKDLAVIDSGLRPFWGRACEVYSVNEAYTSKTCSFCGKIHDIGSKKILSCGCGATVDRDLTGARNILLRALMASSPAMPGIC